MSDETFYIRGKPQIFDGPDRFERSCVEYTKFRDADCRLVFARCREREEIILKSGIKEDAYFRILRALQDYGIPDEVLRQFEASVALREVQAVLIFMSAGNLSEWRPKKSRQVVSDKQLELGIDGGKR